MKSALMCLLPDGSMSIVEGSSGVPVLCNSSYAVPRPANVSAVRYFAIVIPQGSIRVYDHTCKVIPAPARSPTPPPAEAAQLVNKPPGGTTGTRARPPPSRVQQAAKPPPRCAPPGGARGQAKAPHPKKKTRAPPGTVNSGVKRTPPGSRKRVPPGSSPGALGQLGSTRPLPARPRTVARGPPPPVAQLAGTQGAVPPPTPSFKASGPAGSSPAPAPAPARAPAQGSTSPRSAPKQPPPPKLKSNNNKAPPKLPARAAQQPSPPAALPPAVNTPPPPVPRQRQASQQSSGSCRGAMIRAMIRGREPVSQVQGCLACSLHEWWPHARLVSAGSVHMALADVDVACSCIERRAFTVPASSCTQASPQAHMGIVGSACWVVMPGIASACWLCCGWRASLLGGPDGCLGSCTAAGLHLSVQHMHGRMMLGALFT